MPPTFGEVKKFCDKNGWYLIRDTDHWYYEKVLSDGNLLRTRVSHSVSKEIPRNLWRRILKQLQVTDEEFKRGL